MSGAAPVPMRWRLLDWPLPARRFAAGAYGTVLTGALLAPGSTFEEVDRLFPFEDKAAHVALFAALGWLARWSRPAGPDAGNGRRGLGAALALYGVSIEALQPLLSAGGRYFEWTDLAGNLAGLVIGWLLFRNAAAAPTRARCEA